MTARADGEPPTYSRSASGVKVTVVKGGERKAADPFV